MSIVLNLYYLLHKSKILNCFLLKGYTQKECLHISELFVKRKESNGNVRFIQAYFLLSVTIRSTQKM